MRHTLLLALIPGALLAGAPLARAEDCPVHTVARGETLSLIAERYYGEREAFAALFEANRATLGPDPDLIERGQRLTLPCTGALGARLDAAALGEAGAAAPEAPPPAPPAPPPAPPAAPVTLLTGGPFRPFVDEGAAGGGLFTELVAAALAASEGPGLETVVVDDRDAHLWDIMPRGGFDIAAPWFYPDCAADALPPADRRLCDAYIATRGFYEFVTEFYARADGEWASVVLPGGLTGARLCLPAGYPADALASFALPEGAVTVLRGEDPADCLLRLDRQEVEVAAMEAAVTRALIDRVPVENPIVVLETLTRVDRLRVLARRDHGQARALIARLDAALETISADGTWFEIVTRHLRAPPPA